MPQHGNSETRPILGSIGAHCRSQRTAQPSRAPVHACLAPQRSQPGPILLNQALTPNARAFHPDLRSAHQQRVPAAVWPAAARGGGSAAASGGASGTAAAAAALPGGSRQGGRWEQQHAAADGRNASSA